MRWSVSWFTLAFCIAYGVIFALELPVPVYYPLTGVWSLSDLTSNNGTAMHWYGLTLVSLGIGALAGTLCSEAWMPKPLQQWIAASSWLLMAFSVLLLRSFFVAGS